MRAAGGGRRAAGGLRGGNLQDDERPGAVHHLQQRQHLRCARRELLALELRVAMLEAASLSCVVLVSSYFRLNLVLDYLGLGGTAGALNPLDVLI